MISAVSLQKIIEAIPPELQTTQQLPILTSQDKGLDFKTKALKSFLTQQAKNHAASPQAQIFVRLIAYRLAADIPVTEESTFITAFRYLFPQHRLTVHQGRMSEEQFISGQYMTEQNSTEGVVVFPFRYENYLQLFQDVRAHFLLKYKLGAHALSTDAMVPEEVYAPFVPYQILMLRFFKSMAKEKAVRPILCKGNVKLLEIITQLCIPSIAEGSLESCFERNEGFLRILFAHEDFCDYMKTRPIILGEMPALLADSNDIDIDKSYFLNDFPNGLNNVTRKELLQIICEHDDLDKPALAKVIVDAYHFNPNENNKMQLFDNFVYQINDQSKQRLFWKTMFGDDFNILPHLGSNVSDYAYALKFCDRYHVELGPKKHAIITALLENISEKNIPSDTVEHLQLLFKLIPSEYYLKLAKHLPKPIHEIITSQKQLVPILTSLHPDNITALMPHLSATLVSTLNNGCNLAELLRQLSAREDICGLIIKQETGHIKKIIVTADQLSEVLFALRKQEDLLTIVINALCPKLHLIIRKKSDLDHILLQLPKNFDSTLLRSSATMEGLRLSINANEEDGSQHRDKRMKMTPGGGSNPDE